MRCWYALVAVVGLSCMAGVAMAWDDYDLSGFPLAENRRLHVPAHDGVRLAAWMMVPAVPADGRLPAVIIAQDWLGPPAEFLLPAVQLLQRGYVVLLYQARGSGHSGGEYDLAGPDSQRDLRSVYRWLQGQARVDAERVAIVGASAAATTLLLAGGALEDLRAGIALSPWADLAAALNREGAGNPAWMTLLSAGGERRRLQAGLTEQLQRAIAGAPDTDWLRARSPLHASPIAAPLLLTGEYGDPLHDAADLLELGRRLSGSRQLLLFNGGHGAAVMPGLTQTGEPLWEDVLGWLDHWLAVDEPVETATHLIMEVGPEGIQDELIGWPERDPAIMHLYLGPRRALANGTLEQLPPSYRQPYSNTLQGVRNGLSDLQALSAGSRGEKVAQWLPAIDDDAAIQFESRGLARSLPLRGAPHLSLWLVSSARELQVVAYLFESTELGLGRLISKGAAARSGLLPGEPFHLEFDLRVSARDVQPGNHLVLVLDTDDPEFLLPADRNFALRLLFSERHQSLLSIPYNGAVPDFGADAVAVE